MASRATNLNKVMGDCHEDYLIEMLGGTQSPGSGNQWHRPMDGRHSRYETSHAFAWDGKSTMAKSQSVSLTMWEKAVDQSQGERPMLALRYYASDRPTQDNPGGVDLAVLRVTDLSALLADARGHGQVLAALEDLLLHPGDVLAEDYNQTQHLITGIQAILREAMR